MSRYFVALDFSVASKDSILTLSENILSNLSLDRGKLKLTRKENIHATLEFFGSLKNEKIELWRQKVKNLNQDFITTSNYLTLDNLGYFSKKELIIWLGSAEFELFKKILQLPENYVFHITIARCKNYSPVILQDLINFGGKYKLSEKIQLKSIALWRSELKSSGPEYFLEETLLSFI